MADRRYALLKHNHQDVEILYPTFQNSWVNYDANTWTPAMYWKDTTGVVHLQGLVRGGALDTTIFTLPEGYRPLDGLIFIAPAHTGAAYGYARIDVEGSGTVSHYGIPSALTHASAWLSLSGITFLAEQ
jgi:hypothetical protein